MKQLTLEHLAPYFPYGLKIQFTQIDDGISGIGELYRIETGKTDKQLFEINPTIIVSDYELYLLEDEIKPILRPLSDLTKEIEHNGERFVPMIKLADDFYKPRKHDMFGNVATCRNGQLWFESSSKRFLYSEGDNTECPLRIFEMYQKLFSWHFDVFGLIPKGLAIDINTLSK